ncbi:hypothetical protein [Achromobacter xylosoxidans]|uniref:hypothetical protein n=1 Tax=Alcaligenes xylosoxydans xylosoxydans TaxID=85698 RepID=UPI0011779A2F|nr:hypothetical protein [Achromobacter xylosoxidans]
MTHEKAKKTKPTEWANWNPGLNNGNLTLGEVYSTLPTYEFDSYPWIVLLLENPKSPVALKGNCTLLRHDLIHVLLGRGLFVQDESFVIGYTMGTSKRIGGFEKELFKWCAHRLYPAKYRFKKSDLGIYDLGFSAGQSNKVEIFDVPLECMLDRRLDELRKELNIDVSLLQHLYTVEQIITPTHASKRIPSYYQLA